jgi:prolyl 4-hydroxylase
MMRDPLRSSAAASLSPVDLDLAAIAVNRRVSACAGLPDEQGEFLSVMRYRPGEQYRPHFDTVPPGPDFDRNGQRVKTALLYLSKDYEGGETHFLTPDLKVKGATGDVIVFSNVTADGKLDVASRHAGLAVTAGEKWLASKWFRSKNFDF